MPKITVTILKDIKRPQYREPFYARSARIEYYPNGHHQIVYQQGPRYGSVGDCCDDLTHDELLELERGGFVRIDGKRRAASEANERARDGLTFEYREMDQGGTR